jgi:antirestriction protein
VSEEVRGEQEQAHSEQEPRISPKIWISSLSDYNNGHLHGAWVDADQDPDGIWEGINEVLRTSKVPGAEEWAVFDYEGFGPLELSEYETVERISRLGLGIAEHGEAFAVFANYLGSGEDQLLDQFEDCFIGQWESAVAYLLGGHRHRTHPRRGRAGTAARLRAGRCRGAGSGHGLRGFAVVSRGFGGRRVPVPPAVMTRPLIGGLRLQP